MALNLEQKKTIVAEVAEIAEGSLSAVAAHYRGLSVAQMNELRVSARNQGVYLRVVRNTLAKRALEKTDFACMNDVLVGPMVLAFAKDEPGAAARLFKDFAKKNEHLSVQALAIDGKLLGANQLEAVASLPTREEALTQLVAVMKAPVSKFVRTLAEPHAKMVRTFAAVGDKKQAQG